MNPIEEMDKLVNDFFKLPQFHVKQEVAMSYCDYIMYLCRQAISKDPDWLMRHVGDVQFDLDKYGEFLSSKKTLEVEDNNGKKYRVTVEEV